MTASRPALRAGRDIVRYNPRMRAHRPLRLLVVVSIAFVIGCSSKPKPPKGDALFTIPTEETSSFGRLMTLDRMPDPSLIADAQITHEHKPEYARKSGLFIADEAAFKQLIRSSRPIAPDDGRVYRSFVKQWASVRFTLNGRPWTTKLYLGGLGVLESPTGERGAFRFEMP